MTKKRVRPEPVRKPKKPKDVTQYDLRGIRNDLTALDQRVQALERPLRRHGENCPHRGDPLTEPRPAECVCP